MLLEDVLYTAEDLWALSRAPEYAGSQIELSDGRLIVMSSARWKHGGLASLLDRLIGIFVDEHDLGMTTGAETGYILHKAETLDERDTVRAPDVGFIAKARLPDQIPDSGYVPFAPDLAVEVVSPNDDPAEVQLKLSEYLKYGTRLVWVFFPSRAIVTVYEASGTFRTIERDGALDGGAVLPGFSLPLEDVFKQRLPPKGSDFTP